MVLSTTSPQTVANWAGPTLAGAAAMLVGVGLGRFAYTPLIPAVVSAGWFDGGGAAYVGAANLAGYFAGALVAHRFAGAGAANMLRGMMLLVGLSFLACAWPLSFWWVFAWRFLAGAAGAVCMVLAAPLVLKAVPAHRLGLAGGLIFAGVGAGIIASGTLVPFLLEQSLEATWLALGGLCLAITAGVWCLWREDDSSPQDKSAARLSSSPAAVSANVWPILVQYGLIAAALVPHMIFLVDYVARGLGEGLVAGAIYWVLFGFAAFAGPVLTGRLADWVGFRRAFQGGLVAHIACTAWLAVSESSAALILSSLVAGAAVPGFTALALGRVRQVLGGPDQQIAWGRATLAFALMQAAAGFGCSALFDWQGSYTLLFAAGAGAALIAVLIDILWPDRARTGDPSKIS
jgi:predicted MFS family arabinose efflux permease